MGRRIEYVGQMGEIRAVDSDYRDEEGVCRASARKAMAEVEDRARHFEQELADQARQARDQLAQQRATITQAAQNQLATAQNQLATANAQLATANAQLATSQGDLATSQGALATAQGDLATEQAATVTFLREMARFVDPLMLGAGVGGAGVVARLDADRAAVRASVVGVARAVGAAVNVGDVLFAEDFFLFSITIQQVLPTTVALLPTALTSNKMYHDEYQLVTKMVVCQTRLSYLFLSNSCTKARDHVKNAS